jgi:hypothetical protein
VHSRRLRMLLASAIVLGAVAATLAVPAMNVSATTAPGSTITLCRTLQRVNVTGQHDTKLILRNDNYGYEPECLTNSNQWANFVVSVSGATSSIGHGSVAYPEIMLGCAWGLCTPGTSLPRKISSLGDPESSWYITAKAPGIWNAGFDLWFAHQPYITGQDRGAELMVWLKNTLPKQHAVYKRLVRVDGVRYWLEHWIAHNKVTGVRWPYILFSRYIPVNRVHDLQFLPFIARAERAGFLNKHLWLTSLDAGFEIWRGGQGLATDRYWVRS